MKMSLKQSLIALAVLAIAAPLYAVDPAEGDNGPPQGGDEQIRLIPPVRMIDNAIEKIGLDGKQQQQYQQIFKQHAPQIQKHFQQQQQIFTPEQQTKRKEVIKKGRQEGFEGEKLQQYVQSQVPLTPQQQKQYTDCATQIQKAQSQFQQDVKKILTPQQQQLLPPIGGKKGKGKTGKGKPGPGPSPQQGGGKPNPGKPGPSPQQGGGKPNPGKPGPGPSPQQGGGKPQPQKLP